MPGAYPLPLNHARGANGGEDPNMWLQVITPTLSPLTPFFDPWAAARVGRSSVATKKRPLRRDQSRAKERLCGRRKKNRKRTGGLWKSIMQIADTTFATAPFRFRCLPTDLRRTPLFSEGRVGCQICNARGEGRSCRKRRGAAAQAAGFPVGCGSEGTDHKCLVKHSLDHSARFG